MSVGPYIENILNIKHFIELEKWIISNKQIPAISKLNRQVMHGKLTGTLQFIAFYPLSAVNKFWTAKT